MGRQTRADRLLQGMVPAGFFCLKRNTRWFLQQSVLHVHDVVKNCLKIGSVGWLIAPMLSFEFACRTALPPAPAPPVTAAAGAGACVVVVGGSTMGKKPILSYMSLFGE